MCPRFQADELVYQLRKAGAVRVNYILTDAGHSANERANRLKLTAIMDALSALGNAGW